MQKFSESDLDHIAATSAPAAAALAALQMQDEKPALRIIVVVQGGCVQGYGASGHVDFVILDHDNWECVRNGQHFDDCEDHTPEDVAEYLAHCAEVEKMPVQW